MTPYPGEDRGVEISTMVAEVAKYDEGKNGKGGNIGDPAVISWFTGCLACKNEEGREDHDSDCTRGQPRSMKVPPDHSVEAGVFRGIGTKGFTDAYEEYRTQHADVDDVAVELEPKAPLLNIPPNVAGFLKEIK